MQMNLHHKFIMQNLTHRMIFTACALVAHKKGAKLEHFKDLDFSDIENRIIKVLEDSYNDEIKTNNKLKIIKEQYEKSLAIKRVIKKLCVILLTMLLKFRNL